MQPSNFNDIAFSQENVAERIRQNFSSHLLERSWKCCRPMKPVAVVPQSTEQTQDTEQAPEQPPAPQPEQPCQERSWNVWVAPFYEYDSQDGEGKKRGYNDHFCGFTTAFDYQFENHWAVTTGFSFADTDVGIKQGRATADFKTYAGSLGAIWTNAHLFADGLPPRIYSPQQMPNGRCTSPRRMPHRSHSPRATMQTLTK